MASSSPMVNGDVSRGPSSHPGHSPTTGTLEETLLQMNRLIQENRDLKEALKQTNASMKERFEGLSVWREKQREEKEFLEGRLDEARSRMEALSSHNQELSMKVEELEGGGEGKGQAETANQNSELEALRAQLVRLQAEKNDLVAMNSELQLKTGQGSEDDSFIEIRFAKEDTGKELYHNERDPRYDMSVSRQESEELTVSQLLQSLRKETQRVERLQVELQATRSRITELEEKETNTESSTQTSLLPEVVSPALANTACGTEPEPAEALQQNSGKEKAVSEVENLKAQMMSLFNELQQAQSKLGEAEGMKKNLQDRCRDVEQEVVTLTAQLVEKQEVQSENDRLKLQVDSMKAQSQLEQRKAGEERTNLTQLKDAYTKLFEDYNELKQASKNQEPLVTKEVGDLQTRLDTAEKALAAKQQQIDVMKQEMYQKEKELETISVFQAQAEVYSSDFYAERAAREKIHEEKERLSAQLEFVKKQNTQLQDEMDSLGRQSLSDMQRRHMSRGGNPHGGAAPHNMEGARGGDARDWQQQGNIPEHVCPKCNEILPDLDTLQIHIMDCII
ncbi:optineurin isoform X1 [Oncorhynchus tshawytscha]|uniref:optineurin isoform X1 n=1 Tax=Oncorhynchus tshawytscha TaxID=74940 RepID=UPI001C3C7C77|nr:optineurin isoform X1 [Oncorhynchus tshawytscha]XP_042167107.1 optineurin isoform X1 [Oncorhynchus tshawytscha]XP_042167108.1 optineurin isoform X1 [Oncorhynchus tshawytscha]